MLAEFTINSTRPYATATPNAPSSPIMNGDRRLIGGPGVPST